MADPLTELSAAGVSVTSWCSVPVLSRGDIIRPFYADAQQVLHDVAAAGAELTTTT